MAQGLYHYIREAWKVPNQEMVRTSMITWRTENAVTKIEKPTRLDKARMLGYKAKKGRRSKRMTVSKVLKMNYRWVAEQRAQKKFPNLEVLNSYYLAQDGKHYFFEVILVDPAQPEIKSDQVINWITEKNNQGRVFRGLTSAGKKSRGLRNKSPTNKNRPSVRAGHRRGK